MFRCCGWFWAIEYHSRIALYASSLRGYDLSLLLLTSYLHLCIAPIQFMS